MLEFKKLSEQRSLAQFQTCTKGIQIMDHSAMDNSVPPIQKSTTLAMFERR